MYRHNDDTMQISIHAWNTEKDNNSFDCEYNEKLQQYFTHAEPIASLLPIDQELENVFLIKCENRDDYQHYEYELRPDCL
jgi:hypothetical protein